MHQPNHSSTFTWPLLPGTSRRAERPLDEPRHSSRIRRVEAERVDRRAVPRHPRRDVRAHRQPPPGRVPDSAGGCRARPRARHRAHGPRSWPMPDTPAAPDSSVAKVAIVVGGGSGIGRACDHEFAANDHKVVAMSPSGRAREIAESLGGADATARTPTPMRCEPSSTSPPRSRTSRARTSVPTAARPAPPDQRCGEHCVSVKPTCRSPIRPPSSSPRPAPQVPGARSSCSSEASSASMAARRPSATRWARSDIDH